MSQDSKSYGEVSLSIAQNTKKTLVRQVISILIQLITITVIARTLGVEGNGKYAIAMLLPIFLAQFLSMGINASIIYYIGNKESSDKEIYTNSWLISLFIIVLGVTLGLFLIGFFQEKLFPNIEQDILYLSLALFPFSFLYSILLAYLQAKENFTAYNIASLANAIVLFMTIILLYFLSLITIKNVIISGVLSSVISMALTYYFVKKEKYIYAKSCFSKKVLYKILSYGLRSHLSNLVTFINYRADIFLLNLLSNPIAVGLYYVGIQIVERLWIVSSAMSTVLFPRFVALKEDHEARKETIAKSFRIAMLLTLCASILLIAFGYLFIKILFGVEYLDAYYIILALLPGVMLGAGSRILANAIAAKGKPEYNMYTSIVAMVINILLNIFLISYYGFIGAAVATSIAYSFNAIMRVALYKKLEKTFNLKKLMISSEDFKYLVEKTKEFTILKNKVTT